MGFIGFMGFIFFCAMKWIFVRYYWLFTFGFAWGAQAQSSLPAGDDRAFSWALEAATYHTVLWRHTPKLTIRTGQPVWGQEVGVRVQTQGHKPWQAWQHYPTFGVALAHFRLGEQAHGDAVALLPNLGVPVLRSSRWLAIFRVGMGMGYVSKPYDFFENPGQNTIGSHWNNFTQFRLSLEYKLDAHWRIQAGGGLSHFSNGAMVLPNYGVNLPGGFAALVWSPAGIREETFIPALENKYVGRRWGGIVSGGLARVEYSIFDGPRYLVWGLTGTGYFQINRVNRVLAGMEYEFNGAVFAFGLRSAEFRDKHEARLGATRLAFTVADEFLFGNLGLQVLGGIYTGSRRNQLVSHPWYTKLTVRYYLPPMVRSPFRCFAGISLKAHQTTAEMFMANIGVAF